MPQPPPIQGPPGSTSSEPSQGSSITVDWQGREVNRPSARAKGKRKGKGQGKGEEQPEDFDWAYGPARPMTPEERSQFGLQNREWLLRWFASLSPEERTQAGLDQPLLNLGSSNPTSQSDSTLTGIQEEPEQEVPAGDPTVPVQQAQQVEPETREEETLHNPSERDYRDIMMDEAWDPTPDPSRHGPSQPAPKAGPKGFRGKGDPPNDGGRRFDGMGSSQGLAKSIMPLALAQPCRLQCCESHLPAINVASKKTWPESAVVRRSGRKAGAIHIMPSQLDLHPAPPAPRRSMTPASTACKSCVQGDGICEELMKEEGHWVILDASMDFDLLGHTAHNWSGLQLWLERVGYNGLYVFLLLGHFGRCCEVLWNEGLKTYGMVLLHWALSGLTTNVVQCWDIVLLLDG